MNKIIVKNISKSFGEKEVLRNLSFTVNHGEVIQIIGSSGIGKTTLLRLLCGLEKPDAGEIFGVSKTDISFLFQDDRLFPELNALENISIVIKDKSKKEKARRLLSDLGLNEKDILLYPSELSGGMRRRVAIARALAYDKPVLILDEALRGLDMENAENAARVIERESVGKTIIFVTHSEPLTSLKFKALNL